MRETGTYSRYPDPSFRRKMPSHGCMRLTNWDALELAFVAGKGTHIVFTGGEDSMRRAVGAAGGEGHTQRGRR
jgi:hypothetical protein